jgi:hypothetical protein
VTRCQGFPGRRAARRGPGSGRASTRARAPGPPTPRSAPSRRRVYCGRRRFTAPGTSPDGRRPRLGAAGRARLCRRFARPPPQGDRSQGRRACLSQVSRMCDGCGVRSTHERREGRARGAAVLGSASRGAATAAGAREPDQVASRSRWRSGSAAAGRGHHAYARA